MVEGDASKTAKLAKLNKGHYAVIRSFGVDWCKPDTLPLFSKVTQSVLDTAKKAHVKRMISIGGAGGLEVAQGCN